MTVKFVPIDLDTFEIYPNHKSTVNVVRNALSLLPEAEIVFEPPGGGFKWKKTESDDEFYFLLTTGHTGGWYTQFSDTTNAFYSDLLNKKCGLIVSLNEVESMNVSKIVSGMKMLVKNLKIDSDLLYYVDSNANNKKTLNQFKLNGGFFNYYDSLFVNNDYAHIVKDIEDLKERPKKILLLGGNARQHRLRFIDAVLQLPNFEEDNFISTAGGSYFDPKLKKSVKIQERFLDLKPERHTMTDNVLAQAVFFAKTTSIDKFAEPTQWGPTHLFYIESYLHTDSYFQIVTSTWFEMDLERIEINEKHARPMYSLQPFIVFGEPNTLRAFKDMGYKTYSDWIDESYDSVVDDRLRFEKVVALVASINAMSRTDLSAMMKDMLPTLLHNIEHHNKRVTELEIEYKLFNDITDTFSEQLTR